MVRVIHFLRNKLKKQSPEAYHWVLFKELEESLNLIEDIEQIGNNFLGKIKEIINVENLLLLLYDKDLGKFKINNFLGFNESEIKRVSFSLNDPIVKWLKVNKTYFYIREHPGVLNYLTEREKTLLKSLGVEVCCPLISMNRLIGVIFVGPKKNNKKFQRQDLSIISSLTPQTGIALENAVLYKEQRERFRRMLRADKLATIGELAAGAAHEIRNPLTAIKSSLQYLKVKVQEEKANKMLANALQETDRINEILSGMLSFSRHSETKREKTDLTVILKESLELIAYEARKQNINISCSFGPSPVYLKGDKAQLKQLFLNILLNGIQAMEDEDELRVEISPAGNNKMLISISDTGMGIPEENLDKIFDPFFTTKKGGTGLGLSICYGIVMAHKGEIEIKSNVNHGTNVFIKLPLIRNE